MFADYLGDTMKVYIDDMLVNLSMLINTLIIYDKHSRYSRSTT